MKIYKLLRYDVVQGFLQTKNKYLVIALIAWISCIDLYIKKENYFLSGGQAVQTAAYADYVFYLLGGIKECHPMVGDSFIIPIKWLLFNFYLLYCTLGYPYADLQESVGQMVLIQAGSRRAWWISKCIWTMWTTVTAYLTAALSVGIFCLAKGEQLSMHLTARLVRELMDTVCSVERFTVRASMLCICAPVVMMIVINLLQQLLGLFLKSTQVFMVIAIILAASAYKQSPLLPGNYIMPYRYNVITPNGMDMGAALIVATILGLLIIIVGEKHFSGYDITERA